MIVESGDDEVGGLLSHVVVMVFVSRFSVFRHCQVFDNIHACPLTVSVIFLLFAG